MLRRTAARNAYFARYCLIEIVAPDPGDSRLGAAHRTHKRKRRFRSTTTRRAPSITHCSRPHSLDVISAVGTAWTCGRDERCPRLRTSEHSTVGITPLNQPNSFEHVYSIGGGNSDHVP